LAEPQTLDETLSPAPKPVARPLLAWFLWVRGIKLRPAGKALGVSHQQVSLFCLPFDDERRVIPDPETARRIAEWTERAVPPWTFDDTPGSRAVGLTGVQGLMAEENAR
jgi:hypothetical protein